MKKFIVYLMDMTPIIVKAQHAIIEERLLVFLAEGQRVAMFHHWVFWQVDD